MKDLCLQLKRHLVFQRQLNLEFRVLQLTLIRFLKNYFLLILEFYGPSWGGGGFRNDPGP